MRSPDDSIWSLRMDLWSANVLVWLASRGRRVALRPEAHRYLFERYARLAAIHRSRGRLAKARRLQAKADTHYVPAGGEGPPYAAAMAMPRPRRWIVTDAVSRSHIDSPDDAA